MLSQNNEEANGSRALFTMPRECQALCLALIITVFFLLRLDVGIRVGLSIITEAAMFFLQHGFAKRKLRDTEKHERFFNEQGNYLYCRCKPSKNPIYPVRSHGFCGHEIAWEKAGTIRMVCLGGSATYWPELIS